MSNETKAAPAVPVGNDPAWTLAAHQPENTVTTEQNNEVAQRLLKVCMDYIEHHELTCAESIYQKDAIYESAPELVEQICDVIGYYPSGDDDEQ